MATPREKLASPPSVAHEHFYRAKPVYRPGRAVALAAVISLIMWSGIALLALGFYHYIYPR